MKRCKRFAVSGALRSSSSCTFALCRLGGAEPGAIPDYHPLTHGTIVLRAASACARTSEAMQDDRELGLGGCCLPTPRKSSQRSRLSNMKRL